MERNDREYFRRVVSRGDGYQQYGESYEVEEEVPIGELLNRLAADTTLLFRQELSLARAEVKESGLRLRDMSKRLALAAALALPGTMAVTAFLVIALGNAINSYVTSALIVGVVLLLAAWVVARQAFARVSNGGVGMTRTAKSLTEDARWGKEELRAFKREFTA